MSLRGSAPPGAAKARRAELATGGSVGVAAPNAILEAHPRDGSLQKTTYESADSPLKILFVGRSAAHISYFESVIAALQARGANVELLLDEAWSKSWSTGRRSRLDELREECPDLKIGWGLRRSDNWREFLFAMRELRSYRSYLTRYQTTEFYVNRWRNYLVPSLAKRSDAPVLRGILKSSAAEFAMRVFERLAPCDAKICALLKEKNPDVLVATPANMRFSEETDYLKAARRMKILTALPVLSWDNLSTKGLIHIAPDMLFVWNAAHYEDATRIHKIPPKRITIAGAPFFDKWFDAPLSRADRNTFCKRLGLDPKRKILLYLGSSANIAKDETWFVEAVAKCLEASPNPIAAETQLLIRPHPANAKIYGRLEEKGFCIFPHNGALPETREEFTQMRETFHHADAAVGVNTSGMVDAVLADLAVFTVRIPRYANTQNNSRHFRQMTGAGAIYVKEDISSFCEGLLEVFSGNDAGASNRRAFAHSFARPCGPERSAGDVIAETIIRRAKERRGV